MRRVATGVVLFGILASSSAFAQQQFGDPANPGSYVTQRTTAPLTFPGNPTIDVTYFVGNTFSATEHSLINQAAAIWSNAGGASVRLVEVFAAGAGIDFDQQQLNNNTFDLASRVVTSAPGPGTYPNGTPWRTITNADITIDSIPQGGVNNYYQGIGAFQAGQFDYLAILLREFGFGLGLGFAGAGDPNSVMDSDITADEQRSTLSGADISALQTLYGTPEPATWALFGVGLLAMGAARKFRKS